MPNGKPGDHPYTDILYRLRRVYSARIDDLVREVAALSDDRGQRDLADLLILEYNEFERPDLAKLERTLLGLRARLREDASRRGWEP